MINWTVRIKNKAFWVAFIPAVLLLAKQICALFGYNLEVAGLSEQLIDVVSTVFVLLALVGIVNDPTTKNLSDSEQVLTYREPK